jgi:hypothetical protein
MITALNRTGPIIVNGNMICIPACGDLPFFFGRVSQLQSGYLISHQIGIIYTLSFEESTQIAKFVWDKVSGLIMPPDLNTIDSWFLKRNKNEMSLIKGITLSKQTISTIVSFGGVRNENKFIFQSEASAILAMEHIVVNKKLPPKRSIVSLNSIAIDMFKDIDLSGKTALLVNPTEINIHGHLIRSNCMVNVVESQKIQRKLLERAGCELKGYCLSELPHRYKFDYLVVSSNSVNEFIELLIKSWNYCKKDGRLIFLAPQDWNNSKHKQAKLVSEIGQFSLISSHKVGNKSLLVFDKGLVTGEHEQINKNDIAFSSMKSA